MNRAVLFAAILLAALLSGCATDISPDEAARQAQEQQDLQAGVNRHVLTPGDHLGSIAP